MLYCRSRRTSLDFRSLRRSIVGPLETLGIVAGETENEKALRKAIEIETCTRRADMVAQVYAHYVKAYDCFVALVVADLEQCYRYACTRVQRQGTCSPNVYRYATGKGLSLTTHQALCGDKYIRTAIRQAMRREQQHAGHETEMLLKVRGGRGHARDAADR